uniref:Uncharacterized protein n=1 Tax=Clastoptera arizonana TaxID=38151 RepID=A0A1B6CBZ3_9HEMI
MSLVWKIIYVILFAVCYFRIAISQQSLLEEEERERQEAIRKNAEFGEWLEATRIPVKSRERKQLDHLMLVIEGETLMLNMYMHIMEEEGHDRTKRQYVQCKELLRSIDKLKMNSRNETLDQRMERAEHVFQKINAIKPDMSKIKDMDYYFKQHMSEKELRKFTDAKRIVVASSRELEDLKT